jgi:hypothetical protein
MNKREKNQRFFQSNFFPKNRKGQVTIFIIIAIVIVAVVAGYFVFRDDLVQEKVPSVFEPIYNDFISCVESKVEVGIGVLESQGGHLYLTDYESPSNQYPFSSQLNFLGNNIPYWYYVSGNGLAREQVPSRGEMETELGIFIKEQIKNCNYDNYYEQGFVVIQGDGDIDVEIKENKVLLDLDLPFSIEKENSFFSNKHSIQFDSRFGELYDSALELYEKEQTELFLEEYAIDNLRLYAPVDGVELTCSPKIWNADVVFDELEEAIEVNTLALKNSGGNKDYFDIGFGRNVQVNFMTSKNWGNSFEVFPGESNFLIANPVGNQEGLGALGFCYVPYHFVYNLRYPVLAQVYNDDNPDEVFQFPLAIVIESNNPRKPLDGEAVNIESFEICNNKNTLTNVNVYDSSNQRVDADIYYECFGEKCYMGETTSGNLEAEFPQCVNGRVIARADGFEITSSVFSVVQEGGSVTMFMDRVYELNVDLNLDDKNYDGEAIINFISDKSSKTIVYPEQKQVELSEGDYEISVYIYENSDLEFDSTTVEQCVEVAGALGFTKEECFDIEVPADIISNVLSGGGKADYYILESDLKKSVIEINAEGLPKPETLEQLQDNYLLFENKELGINFR